MLALILTNAYNMISILYAYIAIKISVNQQKKWKNWKKN